MALLTAEDVYNKTFQAVRLREGYDQDEVDDFLDEVVATLRVMTAENTELHQKLEAADRRIAELSRGGARPAVAEAPPAETPAPAPAPVAEAPTPAPAPVAAAPVAAAATPAPAATARLNEPESATGMLALAQKLHDDYVQSGQEAGDRLVSDAKTQAARIVREAEQKSNQTLGQLEQERAVLERKIDELRVFERDYRTRLKSYLEGLLADVDGKAVTANPPASAAPRTIGSETPGQPGGFRYGG